LPNVKWDSANNRLSVQGKVGQSSDPLFYMDSASSLLWAVDAAGGTTSVYFTPCYTGVTGCATAGQIRLRKTEVINWRNNVGSANVGISLNASDAIVLGGAAGIIVQALSVTGVPGNATSYTFYDASGILGTFSAPTSFGGINRNWTWPVANVTGLWRENASGVLVQAELSGDATTSGSNAVTIVNLPDGVTQAGHLLATNIAAPASPAAGKVKLFTDSTDLRFHDKNAAGTIGTTVVADIGASNQFLTAISAAGVISKAQPSSSNLSDASALVKNNAANTYTTGDQDFSSASSMEVPATATPGNPAAGKGRIQYDTINFCLNGSNGDQTNNGCISRVASYALGSSDTLTCSTITTTETAFATTLTIPANSLTAGRAFVAYWMVEQTTSSSAPTFIFKERLTNASGTTIYSSAAGSPGNSATGWQYEMAIATMGTAAPGASVNTLTAPEHNVVSGGLNPMNRTGQPVAIGTNAAQTLVLTLTCGASTTGNSIKLLGARLVLQ
jgi:hypothetical protein